ncbi:MAG: EutN/CcmL family microcompartment protein [Anaerolineae bacterium]|nr:EutN/CcmL family microcompartment protein [Anaerolineae bacterium]
MFIGEVIGSVVASQKTDNMAGFALRIVRKISPDMEASAVYAVAVDGVGAKDGEYVLVTSGSPARQTPRTDARPVDAIIMAIVDTWQINGKVRYTKGDTPGE